MKYTASGAAAVGLPEVARPQRAASVHQRRRLLIRELGISGVADQIGMRLENLLAGEATSPIQLRTAIQMAAKALDGYTGTYELAGTRFTIRREGNYLKGEQAGERPVRLYPESDTNFFIRTLNAQVTFRKNMSGEVTGFILDYGGIRRTAHRIP